jgi:hypothetical protein
LKGEMLSKIQCPELLESIFQNLDPSDLLKIDLLSKEFRRSEALHRVWLELCKKKWSIRPSESASFKLEPNDTFKLLYFIASPIPNDLTCCDSRLSLTGTQVRFSGKVGEENRSVKSTVPFPLVRTQTSTIIDVSVFALIRDFLFCRQLLMRGKRTIGHFSCPYVDNNLLINTTPRSIAYYEVQIARGQSRVRSYSNFNGFLRSGPTAPAPEDVSALTETALHDETLLPECVAVGLSSAHFNAECRLPGWDPESFGYHGDDGCLFHGKGIQIAEYGPRFGAGDVVGCGIHYKTRTIFFTLNGRFLGDAFRVAGGELFPTVGIDAEVSITFNFGRAPFVFDLHKYV